MTQSPQTPGRRGCLHAPEAQHKEKSAPFLKEADGSFERRGRAGEQAGELVVDAFGARSRTVRLELLGRHLRDRLVAPVGDEQRGRLRLVAFGIAARRVSDASMFTAYDDLRRGPAWLEIRDSASTACGPQDRRSGCSRDIPARDCLVAHFRRGRETADRMDAARVDHGTGGWAANAARTFQRQRRRDLGMKFGGQRRRARPRCRSRRARGRRSSLWRRWSSQKRASSFSSFVGRGSERSNLPKIQPKVNRHHSRPATAACRTIPNQNGIRT